MNRKRTAKYQKALAADIAALGRYDDPVTWLTDAQELSKSPWPQHKIDEFQKKIDSAFGGEKCIILAWSGDRRYGDVFYNEKGELERKPVLMFAEIPVNERDYCYLVVPRWCLLEVHHGSQLEDSWEESSLVKDNDGVMRRVRPEKPPEFFYTHLKVIGQHETPVNSGLMPPCCERLLSEMRVCYGKYREPSEEDIGFVRTIRENMDKEGVAQRNDTTRSAKLLQKAALTTQYHMKRAAEQQALRSQELMLDNVALTFKDWQVATGDTKSPDELRSILKEAFDEQNQRRFGER